MRLDQFTFCFRYFILFCILIELMEYEYLCPLLSEASDYAGFYPKKWTIQNILQQSEYHLIQLSKWLFLNYPFWDLNFEVPFNFSPPICDLIKRDADNFHSLLKIMLDLKVYKSQNLYLWGARMADQKGELEISQILNNMSIAEANIVNLLLQYEKIDEKFK
uniref:hypothetical protein n=1 Tax=Nitella hyalina TaxID=181804 RepID=UPI00286A7701|nr:hypothetical protein RMD61_pgp084 [Nitella hyalina]WKT08455.1 hypothetical protein [Nitella hyalina]